MLCGCDASRNGGSLAPGKDGAGGVVSAAFWSSQVMCSERLFRVMKPDGKAQMAPVCFLRAAPEFGAAVVCCPAVHHRTMEGGRESADALSALRVC